MGALIAFLAGRIGLSEFIVRILLWTLLILAVGVALLIVRQHLINVGWNAHAAKIQKQDDRAVAASKEVERQTIICSDKNGYWDVITQNCKLEDAQ